MSKKEKPATKLCKHCKTEIPYDAKVCPNCRKRVKGGILKWIIIILVVVMVINALGNDDSDTICQTGTDHPPVCFGFGSGRNGNAGQMGWIKELIHLRKTFRFVIDFLSEKLERYSLSKVLLYHNT